LAEAVADWLMYGELVIAATSWVFTAAEILTSRRRLQRLLTGADPLMSRMRHNIFITLAFYDRRFLAALHVRKHFSNEIILKLIVELQ